MRFRASPPLSALLAVVSLLVFGPHAHASGFAVNDRSVSGLGSAFAGIAVLGQDASAISNNPAAMQQLDRSEASVAIHDITTQVHYTDHGSHDGYGNSISGPSNYDTGRSRATPNLYYVDTVAPRARLGIGAYVPYALGQTYNDQWPGRYQSIKAALTALDISPAFSYQISPKVAVGGSIDAQYMTAKMTTAVDFGALLGAPQGSDGTQTLRGDGWAIGYSLGFTDTLSNRWRLGLVYHSATHQHLTGTSTFTGVPAVLAGTFTDSAASARLNTPQSANLGVAYAASRRLNLLADYGWTGWSCQRNFQVQFANGLPDSVTAYDWRDTRFYALGLTYRLTPRWLLRAGAAYDQSPVPDAQHRSVLGPDTDRRWFTAGFNYAPHDRFSLDAAVAYLSMIDAGVDATDSTGHTLIGSYRLGALFVSLQANWKF